MNLERWLYVATALSMVLAEGIEVPAGRIAVLLDPQGAPFALFEGEVDP